MCRAWWQEVNLMLQEGYYCMGASMLQPVYNNHAPGNWNAHYESIYRSVEVQQEKRLRASGSALGKVSTGQ